MSALRRMTAAERHAYPEGALIREVRINGERADLIVTAYGVAVCEQEGEFVAVKYRPDMDECERGHAWPLWRGGAILAGGLAEDLTTDALTRAGFAVIR